MKQLFFGALAGLALAVVTIAVANVHLWIGTDYPFMPPMGRFGAIATLVLFPIIGAVLAGSD